MTDTSKQHRAHIDECKWIKLLREGDQYAFEQIYKMYFPRLAQFLYRYVNSTHVAEDLVHNVFYSVWNNHKQIQDVETLRPYLYQACRNQALKYLRKEHEILSQIEILNNFDNSHDHSPDEILETNDLELAVIKAVKSMPERRRQIYLMHREDGLTYKEIAEILELSVKTVETQISRSLKYLRDRLSHFIPAAMAVIPLMKDWY